MPVSRIFAPVLVLLAGCTLFANGLLLTGCAEMPRWPAVVLTDTDFGPTPTGGGIIPLKFKTIAGSDIALWEDFRKLTMNAKHWRVNVSKFSNDFPVTGFDWTPFGETTPILNDLPLEVLMRADADICFSDDPKSADAVQTARPYLFMLHKYPE